MHFFLMTHKRGQVSRNAREAGANFARSSFRNSKGAFSEMLNELGEIGGLYQGGRCHQMARSELPKDSKYTQGAYRHLWVVQSHADAYPQPLKRHTTATLSSTEQE